MRDIPAHVSAAESEPSFASTDCGLAVAMKGLSMSRPSSPRSLKLGFGFPVDGMTDAEILEAHNGGLRGIEELRQANPYFAEEVSGGQPQIVYHALSDQWCSIGSVLRCIISDGGPDFETSIWIDDRQLSLREFGRLLSTYNGWGMRITFVPDDEIDSEPVIKI